MTNPLRGPKGASGQVCVGRRGKVACLQEISSATDRLRTSTIHTKIEMKLSILECFYVKAYKELQLDFVSLLQVSVIISPPSGIYMRKFILSSI